MRWLLLALVLVGCRATDPDTGEVYRTVLSVVEPGDGPLVLEDRTVLLYRSAGPSPYDYLGDLGAARRDTLDDLPRQNATRHDLSRIDFGSRPIHMLAREDIDLLFGPPGDSPEGWERFRKVYADAPIVGLSAVGFSDDHSEAVVYVTSASLFLSAWGGYCVLARTDDRGWKVVAVRRVWIS